jgi:hypothetical protein
VWKPNVKLGAAEIVVDRLRHADDRDPAVGGERDAERVVAADRDQRVDAGLLHRFADRCHTVGAVGERIRPRGPEDRSAALDPLAGQHTGPAGAKAAERRALLAQATTHNGTDHRIQAGAIAAPGEQSDAHRAVRNMPEQAEPRRPAPRAQWFPALTEGVLELRPE